MNTPAERALDIVLATVASVVLAPVAATIAILIRVLDGPPVLFFDRRVGLNGKAISVPKFRTMREPTAHEVRSATDEQRLTSLGRRLRRWSLDELPQLGSVIIGDMSLVGPRPLPERYVAAMTAHEKLRHEVRPGITGAAQLGGRNLAAWDQRLQLDLEYVATHSVILNLEILTRTVAAVVRREGYAELPQSTMLDFDKERQSRGDACGG